MPGERNLPARNFFSPAEGVQIVAAIKAAEDHADGEIRVHIENRCRRVTPLQRAAQVFRKLKMHKTKRDNGVLIYLAVRDHRFAIYADHGINEKVPTDFWDDIANDMEDKFRKGDFLPGLLECIHAAGRKLKHHFPRSDDDRENELPDDISYGKQ